MKANKLRAGGRVVANDTTWRIIHIDEDGDGRLVATCVEVGNPSRGFGLAVHPDADVAVPRGRPSVSV